MHYTSAFVAASLLAGGAFANPQPSCTTYYGRHSVKSVSTGQYTKTKTITPTVCATSLRTTTVYPSTITSTTVILETETDTTTISSTDTFTDTSTESTTITTTLDTQTITATTSTTVTTSSTTTTTVGTSAGFVPIRSSVPDSSYNGALGGPPPSKRSLRHRGVGDPNQNGSQEVEERGARFRKNCLQDNKFKTSVGCTKTTTKYAPTVTTTRKPGKTTTITASTPTTTVTSQTTTTITSTEVSTAETTISTTTTISSISTVIPSTTTTSTATATNTAIATSTVYAQCSYINFANARRGVQGVGVSGNAVTELNHPTINNALDCCNQCGKENCGFDLYTAQSGGCYTFTGSDFSLYQAASLDWVVSNGNYAVGPAS